ncbi:KAP family P-loop NTPase fold protein [Rivihabitans pingtungensis]|uniref:KAP-like P-loop domain-containing protein n=1 Tax=Rivihabitans pingtungensis TaxID=1054498 RepID=A0A318KYF7_9NEIS|nr:P-loop NTPase fold protein [Rivihabitans pingtungensis]PXX80676.1 KAP-like P-loop domain-containing protein [Rivihabitans pingtungensis]
MENTDFIFNACHQAWRDTHNWDTCKLNRREYGEFLLNYLLGESGEFVLNLNGAWGSGKTEFLKRLYVAALERGHPVIYINAWESDFSQQPLVVVASELTQQVYAFNGNIGKVKHYKNLKLHCGRFLRGLAIGATEVAAQQLGLKNNPIKPVVENLIPAPEKPEDLMHSLTLNYQSQQKAMKAIRQDLAGLAEVLEKNYGSNLPIIVLVDELDRCRPTYAIEMLEVIKHFFSVDKLVFVVATDTDQLSHSIRAVYGEGFDADTYLRRFFQQRAKLPEPDLKQYILAKYSAEDFIHGNSNHLFGMHWEFVVEVLAASASTLSLSIRSLDNILLRAKAIMHHYTQNTAKLTCVLILFLGLLEHEKSKELFATRRDNDRTPTLSMPFDRLGNAIRGSMISELCGDILCKKNQTNNYGESESYYEIENRRPSYLKEERRIDRSRNFESEADLWLTVAQWHQAIYSRHQHETDGHIFRPWSDYKKMIELSDVLTL